MNIAVGIDLGGTNARGALVTGGVAPLSGEIKLPVEGREPAQVAALVAEVVARTRAPAGAPVGIGFAGMLRGDTGVVANAPNFGWRDVPFQELLEAQLPGRRVGITNDVKAIAFGEFAFGAGRGAADVLVVFMGTGIGGAMISGGRLVRGATHIAGEIGHLKVVTGPAARPCACGARGCVEAYAGGASLTARARDELRAGARSHALDLAGGDAAHVHPGHLDNAARDGDPYAAALWDEIAPHVGLVLANAVTLLNPGRLILGGGVWSGAPELRRRILSNFEGLVNRASRESLTLVDPALGDMAGIIGAASFVLAV
jgi:glucokinase